MHSAGQLRRVKNARFDVFAHEIGARIGRHIAVEREIARFGRDENFVSL